MPRSFAYSVDTAVSVKQIYAAFADHDYWLARISEFDGSATLEEFAVDTDGRVLAVVTNEVGPDGLPGPLAKAFPRRWRVVQEETWTPVGESEVHGEIRTASHGAPGAGWGTTIIVPTRTGARLECQAKVQFKVPLIGGQLENLLGRSLPQSTSMVQEFTARWIAEHG